MARGFEATDRSVLAITGSDAERFLQDLVTNDVTRDGLIYAALLTAQGKFLEDFFLLRDGAGFLLDVRAGGAEALARRLTMYKLRADVAIAARDLRVWQVWDTEIGHRDPRHPALGHRHYDAVAPDIAAMAPAAWQALRVAHLIPETGAELMAEDSYILEHGFERLNGVDFRKGCYVGQEVTARMKHKTRLRKGLVGVRFEGAPPAPGSAVESAGRAVGRITSVAGEIGIAWVRHDRVSDAMTAGAASVHLRES